MSGGHYTKGIKREESGRQGDGNESGKGKREESLLIMIKTHCSIFSINKKSAMYKNLESLRTIEDKHSRW